MCGEFNRNQLHDIRENLATFRIPIQNWFVFVCTSATAGCRYFLLLGNFLPRDNRRRTVSALINFSIHIANHSETLFLERTIREQCSDILICVDVPAHYDTEATDHKNLWLKTRIIAWRTIKPVSYLPVQVIVTSFTLTCIGGVTDNCCKTSKTKWENSDCLFSETQQQTINGIIRVHNM